MNKTPSLDTCGCCRGITALTPAKVENAPGLSALAYRVGTHATFKATLQSALSLEPRLRNLTTRDDDDPSLALLDAWAVVLDVLAFYQERIANEGYLRTAAERRSVLELARAIGYELSPGVAASTYLAFTLEDAKGSPDKLTLDVGLKVQSQPGPGEQAQTFETVEKIEARPTWNAMKPRLTEAQQLTFDSKEVYLEGTSTGLKVGDVLLLLGQERADNPYSDSWDLRRVRTVTPDYDQDRTTVTLAEGARSGPPAKGLTVHAFRQRAALFGHNAPDWTAMADVVREHFGDPNGTNWPDFERITSPIPLDAVYSQIAPDSWIVLSISGSPRLYQVTEVAKHVQANFMLTAESTTLALDRSDLDAFQDKRRETMVLAQSEALTLIDSPVSSPVHGLLLCLDRKVEGLSAGKKLIVTGKPTGAGEDDPYVSEVVTLEQASVSEDETRLLLREGVRRRYDPATVTICGNVALATHGETRREVLGSGDGSQAFQQFVLKQTPLTYVSSTRPGGADNTLRVRVNDLLWNEKPGLYGLDARQRAYICRIGDDGRALVEFGDGLTAARLPSGSENVVATYRVGTGLAGVVKAGQLSVLMTRPLGLKEVTNPLPPSGAADPESLDDARQNTPFAALSLGRIVSLTDFEDFARAFAGIGKAQATWLWSGEKRVVHITVAAANGDEVEKESTLYKNLKAAVDASRDPLQQVLIDSYTKLEFALVARVLVEGDALVEKVLAAVTAALLHAFSFRKRSLGQAVTQCQVMAVMQGVPGVKAVYLNKLYVGTVATFNPILPARRADSDSKLLTARVTPAELLLLSPDGIILTGVQG